MKPDLIPANETDLDRQLRLTIAAMARVTSLPSAAWKRFDATLKEMADKPIETEAR